MDFQIPKWLELLPASHWLEAAGCEGSPQCHEPYPQDEGSHGFLEADDEAKAVSSMETGRMDLSDGKVAVRMLLFDEDYYYQILSRVFQDSPSGMSMSLMQQPKELAEKETGV
ncbi:MAG: stage IV sporulation protein A [Clostridium sp.]